MQRRRFLGILGGTAVAWPLTARAQPRSMPVVGFLNTGSREPFADYLKAFHDGLGAAGYVEGRNVAIEYRWAEGNRARVKEMAADLVRRRVDVIAATGGSPAALEAKAATTAIPIVFQVGVDPVKIGLVASLSRPGGNVTGATMLAADLAAKRLELLRELAPNATTIAALFNPAGPAATLQMNDVKSAVTASGIRLHILEASSARDVDAVFRSLASLQADVLFIGADPFVQRAEREDRCAGAPPTDSRHLSISPVRHSRRFAELWRQPDGCLSPGRLLHRSPPQG